jgi:biopolymer transport protein TolR
MSMAVGGSKGGPKSEINMTPMIDVLLVLIIIFMVINPPDSKGLDALAPQPPPDNIQQQNNDRAVVVQVSAKKEVKINDEVSNFNDLGARLTEIFKSRAEKVAFVKGEADTEFRYVAEAIDIAKGAGVEKVGIMTPKIEAGQ